jgi:hypothetical protein
MRRMASSSTNRAGIRKTWASALALVLGLFARSVGAAPTETEPIRLDYTAPAGCPDASEFGRRVFERTSKARSAGNDETARTFVVVIETTGAETRGSMVVRQDGMSTVARRVSGKDCEEVARALALATALAIDPEAALTTPEPSGPGVGGSVDGPGTTDRTPEPQPKDPARPADKPSAGSRAGASTSIRRAALLFGPSLAFGPAPTPGFGASAAVEWSSPSPVVLPSALGAELVFLTSAEHSVRGAGSSFDFVFVRPYVCTLGLAFGADVGLVPCIGGALGAVVASGSRIASPATETRFWAAGELALRLDIALADDWFVDATGGVVLPFTRYRFLFRTPDTRIHHVPAVTAAAGLRIGRRL